MVKLDEKEFNMKSKNMFVNFLSSQKICNFLIPNLTPLDVTDRLAQINPYLENEVRQVLNLNKAERHIRGGMATREKYLHHLKGGAGL